MLRIYNYKNFILEKLKEIKAEIKLPKDIINIAQIYDEAGKDIFLVGGAVRDFIQGKEPKDWDLVTNALPDESIKILRDKGMKISDEQGKNFGVLRLFTKDEPEGYEIASYRKDISLGRDTKGDDQKVEMGNHITIEDDCMRRDLTMNALFYDIKNKKIIDIVGGVSDIKNGIVRAVGEPLERFKEDRLRILRIFRFAARTGGVIDNETANAIKSDNRLRGVSTKDDVSKERIWDEFEKSWKQALNFNNYLNFYTEFDMWDQVFEGIEINKNQINSKSFLCNIANLFIGNNNGLENKLTQTFKMESKFASKIVFLLNMEKLTEDKAFDFYKKKIQSSVTNDLILEWIRVQNINSDLYKAFIRYSPSVSSKELMDKGFTGRELGLEIKRLETEKFNELLK